MPAKATVVDGEIEKFGLRLNRRTIGGDKWVYKDASAAGREAGKRLNLRTRCRIRGDQSRLLLDDDDFEVRGRTPYWPVPTVL